MKTNDKGLRVPDVFMFCHTGSRKEALARFSPEGAEYREQEFWEDVPDQRRIAMVLGEDEVALMIKVLARGAVGATVDEEREFSKRMVSLISASVHEWEQSSQKG